MSFDPKYTEFDPATSGNVICAQTDECYISLLFNTHPLDYLVRIFTLQVSLVCVIAAILQFLLKPLGKNTFVTLMLGGVIIGAPGLSLSADFLRVVFPIEGSPYILDTLGDFGCMIYIFLVGVKMDLSLLKRSSRKEKVIGISTFILPMLLTVPLSLTLKIEPLPYIKENPLFVAIMASTSSFHTISCFLDDLKILNTELGRIATSASTVSGLFSWMTVIITSGVYNNFNTKRDKWAWFGFTSSAFAQVLFIYLVLRKIVIWMIKKSRQGERVKDTFIFSIFLMILATGLVGEYCGQRFIFGPLILGLVIPNGPPIGSSLADKWDTFISGFFLPLYFCGLGNNIALDIVESYHLKVVILLFGLGFLGKVIGTVIPCLYYKVPFQDAVMLSLTMSTLGVLDMQNYRYALDSKVLSIPDFAIIVLCALALSGIITPVVHFCYDPSKRYIVYKKRTIQNVKSNSELRLLVCVYNEENFPTIVNILEASNPTTENPIIVYLLHLVELVGRSTPLLIAHKPYENNFDNLTQSDRIINGFKIIEKKNQGAMFLQPFTSITHYLVAHEDICTLALNKRTSFLIIPFHIQRNIDGSAQTYKWRNSNKKVLAHAPCSVGILIYRGLLNGSRSVLHSCSTYNVAIIFLGDADDREALCYGMRMAKNPAVQLKVYRLIVVENVKNNVTEKVLDENVINEYKFNTKNERNMYEDVVVKDGVGIISVIRSMKTSYTLILVGRSHHSYSKLFSGFIEWNEYPELGIFGDMLASSDFQGNASILVVQQHSITPTGYDVIQDEE